MRVDLKNDIIFKAVFGKEKSKNVLTHLINAVLIDSGFSPISEVILKNPVLPGDTSWTKSSELDILALDESGKQYNVEMQIAPKINYENRSLYYWAKLYASQMKKGEEYKKLRPVICINFIDFVLNNKESFFHRCFMVLDKDNNDVALSDDLQIHFIELDKLEKNESKLTIWVQLLKLATETSTEENMKYIFERDPATKEAFDMYKDVLLDDMEWFRQISREKHEHDVASFKGAQEEIRAAARAAGLQEGREQGLEEGREEGREQGREQGREEGREQGLEQGSRTKAIEIAKSLLLMELSVDKVSQVTGLSEKEVRLLKK